MLFNSNEFIFGFLPVVLLGFYMFGRSSRNAALIWLTLSSLFFYAWWRPINVLLIAPSILVNFGLARAMQGLVSKEDRRASLLLAAGIVFNVLFLCYFKYRNFFLENVNLAIGTEFPIVALILPLGISFITFQKIAFLVDVHGGRVSEFTLREYFLFVLFFPQLIAGPIVHYTEVMPQFRQANCRFQAPDFTAGLTLFVFGLFKKVVLADGIAQHVSALFLHSSSGVGLSLLPAWLVAIGYTLQLYFDFSAYSDMALGLARLFGIRLPVNFDSPLRATSIIDFWRRWHITLTRFLTAYIYNPMVLSLTRRRLARGKPGLAGAAPTLGAFMALLAFPTLLVMLISGIWHGAGFKFAIWGLLHGLFLCCNHAWRALPTVRRWRSTAAYKSVMGPTGFVLTFVSVVFAMVFFGAPGIADAFGIVRGMIGAHGVDIPAELFVRGGPLASALRSLGVGENSWWSGHAFFALGGWTAILLTMALASPNTLQIMGWISPGAGGASPAPAARFAGLLPIRWNSSPWWGLLVAALGAIAASQIGGPSEFLYWQF